MADPWCGLGGKRSEYALSPPRAHTILPWWSPPRRRKHPAAWTARLHLQYPGKVLLVAPVGTRRGIEV